ncbi:hypothetical protein QOZ80_4BG0337220 [Eleusine coracana subsp. coracana]|nr:hypothetical protein QOZ80_4BG0337220 [Eleusine coracana subsp. coracana]
MAPPPPPSSSLLRDLLAADGFKNRRNKPPDNNNNSSSNSSGLQPAASRAASMPAQHRRPGKPARSQSDKLVTRSRLSCYKDGGRDDDAGEEKQRAATATRRSSASLTSATSYSDKGKTNSGAAGAKPKGSAAVPAMDESALNAVISLAARPMKRFATDESFRASLRAACASCLGYEDEEEEIVESGSGRHRAALDLRVVAQTVERAAREAQEDEPAQPDPRDLKRASARLHELASLDNDADDAHPSRRRLAACAHVYISAVSVLRRRDHSAAVHALEAFCLAPREARAALMPALWDRLFRPGLSHLRAWRDREASSFAAAGAREDDGGRRKVKEVEKVFSEFLDEGTRVLACYYRDWLLGRTDAMALPDVAAPPSTVQVRAVSGLKCSTSSTSYDVGSDVVYSSGSTSPPPTKVMNGSTVRVCHEIEIEEEEEVHGTTAYERQEVRFSVHDNYTFQHECDDGDARRGTPTLLARENTPAPKKLVQTTFESQTHPRPTKESGASTTSYPLISDISALELLTLEFCDGPLQSDADGYHYSVFATVPSDFLCPLTRQVFTRPVTIETGQTFERHAIVHWFDRGFRACPVTGQELESLSVPDTNRVLRRLIDNWKSEHCEHLLSSEGYGVDERLTVDVVDRVLGSARDVAQNLDKARHLMAIGGVDFLLRRFLDDGGDEEKVRAAEHLLLCIRAEGGCRNYVAVKISGTSVLQLLHSQLISARRTAVCLLTELLCLTRREMLELPLRGLGTESIIQAMDVLLDHLRSLPVEEQAPVAVLLLHFDALVENHSNNTYREEAAKTITHSLRCCLSDDNVVPNTRKALLLLGGKFSFSGDLLTEDWMLKQAGFIDDSRATPIDSDGVVQDKEAAEHEAWLRKATVALLGGNGRKPFLEALSKCLVGSRDADLALAGACLTTAGWLTRSLASVDDGATDMQLAAFSALVPRLKQCLMMATTKPARLRVLAVVSLHNLSRIPDCRELLMLLGDGLRDHLADLAELTWTARQLSAQLHE